MGSGRENLNKRVEEAVRHFWTTRKRQSRDQGQASGRKDQGRKAPSPAGRRWTASWRSCATCCWNRGCRSQPCSRRRKLELPGYFRPEKQWDLLVVVDGQLLASIEFKSQVGPSFGNNYNNRSEESLGNATDLWAAYREGAFRPSPRPWLGYLMLLEEAPESLRPVGVQEPHFKVFDEFRNASYAERYEILLTKLLRERLYDGACLLLSNRAEGVRGKFKEPSRELAISVVCQLASRPRHRVCQVRDRTRIKHMPKQIGILTSGGDCPGLNAAIRGVGKAARDVFRMELVGFRDGFRGLVYDRTLPLESNMLSGILTSGGTILGTSRDKPHQMEIGGEVRDMTGAIVDTYARNHLDAIVCIGGGGTQKNALRLKQAGLNVITLPKTIDNDIAADRRLPRVSTRRWASPPRRSTGSIRRPPATIESSWSRSWAIGPVGWPWARALPAAPTSSSFPKSLTIPSESPRPSATALGPENISASSRWPKGPCRPTTARLVGEMLAEKQTAKSKGDKKKASARLDNFHQRHLEHTVRLTEQLEKMTGQESRLTILGHLQRGGTPSPADRLLGTRLGASCAEFLHRNVYGVMLAARGDGVAPVPLEEVAGKKKFVPLDHPWVQAAKLVGVGFGN